ncbi:MAG: T9SS type A sorting domain-containing protein [Flavobacteriales bacterium]|nr:T9SS type A sorting domain-containing protein [Flavobacteriales bacterium]MBP9079821.1 T9SS type A sorting domain-containing protein [Flavobacteriales bacterium]
MKHVTPLLFAGALTLAGLNAQAQCTTWVAPTPTSGWVDFTSQFGGAPTPDGAGNCVTNEINAFEVFADEAYAMENITAGVTYTFSACNGTGGTAWSLMFTIVAPSGAVDAFGLNAGSSCALSWTASETGSYLIVVSEDGACGTSANAGTSNGFPSITCGGVVGIADVAGAASFSVYPNPSAGEVTINLEQVKLGASNRLNVVEVSGRTVYSTELKAGVNNAQLDLGGLTAGTYYVVLHQDGQVLREKLVLVNN